MMHVVAVGLTPLNHEFSNFTTPTVNNSIYEIRNSCAGKSDLIRRSIVKEQYTVVNFDIKKIRHLSIHFLNCEYSIVTMLNYKIDLFISL